MHGRSNLRDFPVTAEHQFLPTLWRCAKPLWLFPKQRFWHSVGWNHVMIYKCSWCSCIVLHSTPSHVTANTRVIWQHGSANSDSHQLRWISEDIAVECHTWVNRWAAEPQLTCCEVRINHDNLWPWGPLGGNMFMTFPPQAGLGWATCFNCFGGKASHVYLQAKVRLSMTVTDMPHARGQGTKWPSIIQARSKLVGSKWIKHVRGPDSTKHDCFYYQKA